MNVTSPSVNRMPARSEASAAEIVRLGWPGAPGCTIGGCAWLGRRAERQERHAGREGRGEAAG